MLNRIIGIVLPWLFALVMIGISFCLFPGFALLLILFGLHDLDTHEDNYDNQDYY